MGVRSFDEPVGLYVPGLYERIKNYELQVALRPDPRVSTISDPDERERVAATAPRYSPTALNQVDALMSGLPIVVPRSYVGGRSYREFHGWPPYDGRRIKWFIVTSDDRVMPGGDGDGGFMSERTLRRAAQRRSV